ACDRAWSIPRLSVGSPKLVSFSCFPAKLFPGYLVAGITVVGKGMGFVLDLGYWPEVEGFGLGGSRDSFLIFSLSPGKEPTMVPNLME
ncbi:hypothetical protein Taro_023534, partial [Colocasia esculenta]|nr:hypothetical protein [Colocasia esculenta]